MIAMTHIFQSWCQLGSGVLRYYALTRSFSGLVGWFPS